MREAFHIAQTGRPGPVLVDVPRDVLTESAEFDYPEHVDLRSYKPTVEGHGQMIKRAAGLIAESRRPLLLVGHGALIARAEAEVREVAEKAQIPVITTLLGIGAFAGDHVLSLGMPGMHGQAHNNWAIDRADLIIGVGMRFDDRVTGRLSAFAPNAKVVHIDIDPAEVGKNVGVTVPIVGDAKRVLHALAKEVERVSRPEWIAELEALRAEHPLSDSGREGLPAAADRAGALRGHRRPRGGGDRRWPAPDVGGAALRFQGAGSPGSRPAVSARWGSRRPRRWAPHSRCRGARCGASPETAASR